MAQFSLTTDATMPERREVPPQPIRLRAHTVLCLQGFRGEGYDRAFVENLAHVHGQLSEQPNRLVEIIDSPDVVCGACPHRAPSGCTLRHEHSEREMQAQDRLVLSLLELSAGSILSWNEILNRIGAAVTGDSLPKICGQCRWLPLGYCREGIDRLKVAGSPVPAPLLSVDRPGLRRAPSS